MLTTKDINLKPHKDKSVKIISTSPVVDKDKIGHIGNVEPKQFGNKKEVRTDKKHPSITTGNVEKYRKKYEDDVRMAKAREAKKKKSKK